MGKNGRANKHASKHTEHTSNHSSKPTPTKKAAPKPSKKTISLKDEDEDRSQPTIPLELQQLLLNIFTDSFPATRENANLQEVLQEVKAALYKRDFSTAFGREEYLQAYAVRWSPSRALGYMEVLVELKDHLSSLLLPNSRKEPELNIVCFGGCAAEIVAFGGFLKILRSPIPQARQVEEELDRLEEPHHVTQKQHPSTRHPKVNLTLIDSANWQQVIQQLGASLFSLPSLPKYANTSARENNTPLLHPGDLSTIFRCEDVLDLSLDQLSILAGEGPRLFTLLFTLNELYTASVAKTTAFLLKLTAVVKRGSFLLVVDSPGSYSEMRLGEGEKGYPMGWLLDHTLGLSGEEDGRGENIEKKQEWDKVVGETSRWFRVPEGVRYPIPLENMRFQMFLYRRV